MFEQKYLIIVAFIWGLVFPFSVGLQPLRKIFIKNFVLAIIYSGFLLIMALFIDSRESMIYLFLGLFLLAIHSILLLIYLITIKFLKRNSR